MNKYLLSLLLITSLAASTDLSDYDSDAEGDRKLAAAPPNSVVLDDEDSDDTRARKVTPFAVAEEIRSSLGVLRIFSDKRITFQEHGGRIHKANGGLIVLGAKNTVNGIRLQKSLTLSNEMSPKKLRTAFVDYPLED